MFLAVPVEHKPSLKSPPWMTIALIVINVLIYFGWQVSEETAVRKAASIYAESPLPALELPRFVEHIQRQREQDPTKYSDELVESLQAELADENYSELYVFMWDEHQFRVIRADDEQYDTWRSARQAFNAREPEAFTTRWSQDYALQSVADVLQRPITLLTSTFLHGGFMHLLGNMVFLFIFGFTLEKTLGPGLYLGAYLLAGLGASIVAAWAYAGSGGYGLGASGAISGLMGALLVLVLRNRGDARTVLMWIGINVVITVVGSAGISWQGHLGGFLGGIAVTALLVVLRKQRPWQWMAVAGVATVALVAMAARVIVG